MDKTVLGMAVGLAPDAHETSALSEHPFSQPLGVETTAVIPMIQEELDVHKQQLVTGTVRIKKVVHEREAVVEEPVIHHRVEIEWIAINRVVAEPPPVRQEGETTIYPVVEEILVVTKQLVLKEEIRITSRSSESTHRQSVTLRVEEVVVEREETTNPNNV